MAPVAAQYVVTFLKPEMHHVFRQITALQTWRPVVFTQKRENATQFPFNDIRVLPKPRSHQLRRLWQKTLRGQPITIYPSEARRTLAALHEYAAELLHIYFGHIGVHLLPLLEIADLPVLVSFHGADADVDWHRPGFARAMRKVFARADALLVRSESLGARLIAHGAPQEKIQLHRTGIPLEEVQFRQRIAPDGDWHLLQACRLIPKKGLSTTLRAFAQFSRRWPQARLTIAGDGPERSNIERFAAELEIGDRVKLPGFVSQTQLREIEASAHLFIHPSEAGPDGDQEGVPNAMLEAMAAGLPVCATQHGGIPEAVEHGRSGLLVAEGDAEGLARSMHELAANPDRYAAMSAAASDRIHEHFSTAKQAQVLEGIYSSIVTQRRP